MKYLFVALVAFSLFLSPAVASADWSWGDSGGIGGWNVDCPWYSWSCY